MCNLEFEDKYIFAAVLEKQPFRKISEIKLTSEAAIRMHFSILMFSTYSEFLEKLQQRSGIFSKPVSTFSNFEPRLQKFKYYYSSTSALESTSAFRKSRENFNLEELSNSMLVGYNFTKNFTVDLPVGIFWNVSNNIHSCFS